MVDIKVFEEMSKMITEVTCYNCETVHVIDLARWDRKHWFNLYEKCGHCEYVFSFDVETQYVTRSFAAKHMN